jgi:hypothetical protein
MAFPTGNFAHELPGRLRVTFQGQYAVNDDDAGAAGWAFPVRCYVDDLTALLGPACVIETDYPGSYAEVPVGMEEVSHTFGGTGTIAWTKLVITCRLDPYV